MTLLKAIEIKQRTGPKLTLTDQRDIDEADRLSFEAMKRVEIGRGQGYDPYFDRLPGETKE